MVRKPIKRKTELLDTAIFIPAQVSPKGNRAQRRYQEKQNIKANKKKLRQQKEEMNKNAQNESAVQHTEESAEPAKPDGPINGGD